MANYTSAHTGDEIDLSIASGSTTTGVIKDFTTLSGSATSTITTNNIVTQHITASGNISSSGIIIADTFQSTGGDVGGISFTDDLNITGNITASGDISAAGNISASGNISSSRLYLNIDGSSGYQDYIFKVQEDRADKFTVDGAGNISVGGSIYASQYLTHTGDTDTGLELSTNTVFIKAGGSGLTIQNGHITASGDISASGDGHFSGINIDNGSASDPTINFIKGSSATGLLYDGTNFVWKREGSTALSIGVGNITFGGGGNSKISAVTNTSLTLRGGTTNTLFNTTGITTEGSISSSGAINTLSHITASGNISGSSTSTFTIGGNATIGGGNVGIVVMGDNVAGVMDGIAVRNDISASGTIYGGNVGSQVIIENGHITASGNISGSSTSTGSFGYGYFSDSVEIQNDAGELVLSSLSAPSTYFLKIQANYDSGNSVNFVGPSSKTFLQYDNGSNKSTIGVSATGITNIEGQYININSHITASGNISASGDIYGTNGRFSSDTFIGGDQLFMRGTTETLFHASSVLHINRNASAGTVTIGGNISGSATSTGSFGAIHTIGEGRFSGDTTLQVTAAASGSDSAVSLTKAANGGRTTIIPNLSADRIYTLPTPEEGLSIRLVNLPMVADSHDLIVSSSGDVFLHGGFTWESSGSNGNIFCDGDSNKHIKIDTPSSADLNFLGKDSTTWYVWGRTNTVTIPVCADDNT
jgi:hypothetical protein